MLTTFQKLAVCGLVAGALGRAVGVRLGGDMFVLAWACGLLLRPCSGAGSRLVNDEIWYDATSLPIRQQVLVAVRVAEWASAWFGTKATGRNLHAIACELLGQPVDTTYALPFASAPLVPVSAAWTNAVNRSAERDAKANGVRRLGTVSALRPAAS